VASPEQRPVSVVDQGYRPRPGSSRPTSRSRQVSTGWPARFEDGKTWAASRPGSP